jgi:hypothetical protein
MRFGEFSRLLASSRVFSCVLPRFAGFSRVLNGLINGVKRAKKSLTIVNFSTCRKSEDRKFRDFDILGNITG